MNRPEPIAGPVDGWHQAPDHPPVAPIDAWRGVLSLAIAAVGPVWRTWATFPGERWRAGVVLALALVAVGLGGSRFAKPWFVRLGIALVAGAAAAPIAARSTGLWLAGSILVALWAARGDAPLPMLPRAHDATIPPVLVLQVVAGYQARSTLVTTLPLVLTAASGAVVLLGSVVGHHLARISDAFSAFVGKVVTRLIFGILGVFVVVLPWIVQRIWRTDPLAAPTPAGTGWVPRARRDQRPKSPWADDPALLKLPLWLRVRRYIGFPVLAICLTGIAMIIIQPGNDTVPPPPGAVPEAGGFVAQDYAAFEGDSWYPDYAEELNYFFQIAFDPTNLPRHRDVKSTYINVVDGDRVSWKPPKSAARRLTVWVYGGSTTWGVGQRDLYTVPSQLARVAYDEGVSLDVVNKGVNGDLHWMEAERFAWDLATEPEPDLVVFYDGVNEMMGALHLQDRNRSKDLTEPVDPTLDKARIRDLAVFGHGGFDPNDGPGDAVRVPPQRYARLGAWGLGIYAVKRYEVSRKISRDLGKAHDLPIVYTWQGSRFSRPPNPGEPNGDPAGERHNRRWWQSAREHLPDDVVDLTEAIMSTDQPIFFDDMHTNEQGAHSVGQAMFEAIRPQLERLLKAPAEPGRGD